MQFCAIFEQPFQHGLKGDQGAKNKKFPCYGLEPIGINLILLVCLIVTGVIWILQNNLNNPEKWGEYVRRIFYYCLCGNV